MKTNTIILSCNIDELEQSVLATDALYTITYQGTQICIKQSQPRRATPSYKFLIYSNPGIAAKKMRELNRQYQTLGFRVERVSATQEVERESGCINDMSTNNITYIRTEKGWIEQ